MSYFRDFPKVFYAFGNEELETYATDLSAYADILDQVKDTISFYEYYDVLENERPDQVSFKLYDTPQYHWTFFLMNDNIREKGWPLSNNEIIERTKREHTGVTLTTRDILHNKFKIGQTISGTTSGATGVVYQRNLDLGQIKITPIVGEFQAGELLSSINENDVVETLTIVSVSETYLAARHYVNGNGLIVDIDPTVGPGAQLTEVTHLDYYIEQNDSLRQIKVIQPDAIFDVVNAFQEAISN